MHLADITPSIFAGLGLTSATDSLSLGQSPHGREVLFLVDGLGADVIEKYKDLIPTLHSFTHHGVVATSFPSTTATSLATLMTGELPGTHAMLGYTVRVPRSGGRVLNSLKWDERVDPVIWQKIPTMFERAVNAGISVTHVAAKRYEGSGFTQAALRGAKYVGANSIEEMVTAVHLALKPQPSFVYTYLNNLDSAGHSDGVGSDKWLTAFEYISEFITKIKQSAPAGTRIWITSDHGMINSTEQIILGQDNKLLENVTLIGGEPRARHIYVEAGALAETITQWQEFFGDKAKILSRQDAITTGLFGPVVTQDSSDRMGDLIAIANGDLILVDPARVKEETSMVGHHGGVTDTEVAIPLLLT